MQVRTRHARRPQALACAPKGCVCWNKLAAGDSAPGCSCGFRQARPGASAICAGAQGSRHRCFAQMGFITLSLN